MEFSGNWCSKAAPFLAVIFLQFGYAGMSIITKLALDRGMSQHVLVAYRHAIATIVIAPFAIVFDRKVRPKMTMSIFIKIAILGLLEPTIDQNLFYTGMKYTTATFTSAMSNVLPAFAFLMAWALRLEKVNVRKLHSQAKILGTVVTVGGAMLMTVVKGAQIHLPWTNGSNQHVTTHATMTQHPIAGAIMIASGCLCWAGFIILQAITLQSYPVELSLTALICLMGTIEGTVLALVMERGKSSVWALGFDYNLLAAAYSGIICSGIAYYVQGVIMKSRGPVFVTAFNPLSMVIVTILGSFVLSEKMYLGRILGAAVIVTGLYLVLWGKSKDQPSSNLDIDKVIECSEHQQTGTTNGKMGNAEEEFVAIDVGRVRPTNDRV